MPEENQRIRLTKQLLRQALLDLAEEKPVSEIGVTELCRRAGINRTTFYNHYGNPVDVLSDIEQEAYGKISRQLNELADKGELSLAKRVETICTYLRAHERTAKVLFARSESPSEFAMSLFELPLGWERQRRRLHERLDAETRSLMITYLTHGTYSLVRKWLLEDMEKTPEQMGKLAEDVALNGWAR
jgi:AcrR family transcriptional regulator